jgi:hypothetical protein
MQAIASPSRWMMGPSAERSFRESSATRNAVALDQLPNELLLSIFSACSPKVTTLTSKGHMTVMVWSKCPLTRLNFELTGAHVVMQERQWTLHQVGPVPSAFLPIFFRIIYLLYCRQCCMADVSGTPRGGDPLTYVAGPERRSQTLS